ncbi:MAG: AraC family transcriptional regulator [Candidatus Cloacimonetes bacterium]|nr:AraC family transcriptional regulator [Candidatus Cloacimonadota bacterium]
MRLFNQIRQLYKAVCFIESNLQEEITVAQMADEAGYSLFHFCRQFSRITGFSPFHYLIKRRIHQSVYQLLNTDHNISRIAFEFCFNSPETYSRAFRRILGVLPQQFRNYHKEVPKNLLMPALTKQDLNFRNQTGFSLPEIVELGQLRLCGLMGKLSDKKLLLAELKPDDTIFEIREYGSRSEEWFVFIGSENCGRENQLYIQKKLKPARWIKAGCKENEQQLMENFIHHTWLPSIGEKVNPWLYMLKTDHNSEIILQFISLQ